MMSSHRHSVHDRAAVLSFLAIVLLASCKSGGMNPGPTGGVDSVLVAPAAASIVLGATVQLGATVLDTDGDVLSRAVTWSTDNASVATVSTTGLVSAQAVGSTQVRAAVDGVTGSATIFVTSVAATGTVNVDPSTTYQTIGGWEAVAQIGGTGFTAPVWQGAVLDSAVSIGINRLRLEIRSGIENPVDYWTQLENGTITFNDYRPHRYEAINDNSDANSVNPTGFQFAELDYNVNTIVNPLRSRLAAVGQSLWVNLTIVDFNASGTLHRENPAEYAELVLATFRHLETTFGWVPNSVEVILEPDLAGWQAAEIGTVLVGAGARLAANGFTPDFVAPSTTDMANAITFFDQIVAVPGVLTYLDELSYHRYSGVSDANLLAIGARGAQYNVRTAMLEHLASGYDDLHKDLKLANNSSWEQFALAFPLNSDDGSVYFIINPTTNAIQVASRTGYLRQYFKYLKSGATRIRSTSSDGALDPLAFVAPDGKYTLVVKATTSKTFTIGGLPPGVYGVSYATAAGYGISAPDVNLAAGTALSATIPAAGVITIFGK
ncbi:MAG: Ig-like domain-containing protein [Longimicrobiales bacterium]